MQPSVTPGVIVSQESVTCLLISPKGNKRHHYRMDDIYLIRRKNLAAVCREKVAGNQSELGRALGIVSNLVNRYLKSKRIGDDVARVVEKTYGLESGWMDNVHPSDREALVLLAFRTAHPEIQSAVERALNLPFTQTTSLKPSPQKTASYRNSTS